MGAAKANVSDPGAVHDEDFILWWRRVGIHEFPYEMREALAIAFRAGAHGANALAGSIESAVSYAIHDAEDRIVTQVTDRIRRIVREALP